MYVHDEKRLCFLASPRTGSRSWRDALMKVGFRRVGAHHTGPRDGFDTSGYETFCVVRNHWDAVLSWWFYRYGPKYEPTPSLDWMARHLSVNSHTPTPRLWYHAEYCDHVIRFETMDEEYKDLMSMAFDFDEYPPLLHVGRSLDRHNRRYQDFYRHECNQFVEWVWRDEIKYFGYRFETTRGEALP